MDEYRMRLRSVGRIYFLYSQRLVAGPSCAVPPSKTSHAGKRPRSCLSARRRCELHMTVTSERSGRTTSTARDEHTAFLS